MAKKADKKPEMNPVHEVKRTKLKAADLNPRTIIGMVAVERQRQIDEEKFTAEHDDKHDQEELIDAAHAYIAAADNRGLINALDLWPWEANTFRPSASKVRNLVKAIALLIAEAERLQRAEEKRKK